MLYKFIWELILFFCVTVTYLIIRRREEKKLLAPENPMVVALIALGLLKSLHIGNLDSKETREISWIMKSYMADAFISEPLRLRDSH